MGSTEDYLDNLLANAVSQEKGSSKTKASTGNTNTSKSIREDIRKDAMRTSSSFSNAEAKLDSLLSSNTEDDYRQPIETEEGDVIGLDDTFPDEYIPETENIQEQEVSSKTEVIDEPSITPEIKTANLESPSELEDIKNTGFEEFNPSSKFESFLSEFGEDDIEKRLAEAADVSGDVGKKIDETAEVTDIIDAISEEGDSSMDDIANLLKASDNNKIVDPSLLNKLEKAEAMGDLEDEEDSDEASDEEAGEANSKKNKKNKKNNKNKKDKQSKGTGLFGKLFGKKAKDAEQSDSQESAGNQIDVDYGELTGNDGENSDYESRLDDDFDKLLAETAAAAGHELITDDESDGEPGSESENRDSEEPLAEALINGADSEMDSGMNSEMDSEEETTVGDDTEEAKPKKKGLIARILDFLTEEEPEVTMGEEGSLVSDENKAILEEIDAEDEGKKKGKKGKKAKKEKEPKEKKPKKPKKPKKEKVQEPIDPKKIVPMKMKVTIFALAFSVLAIVLLLMKFIPSMMNMGEARKAYYSKDYKDTFISMYGKKLSESDRILYEKAKILVLIERKYESYENYMTMDMPVQALDALMQGLMKYEVVKDRAEEYGVLNELNQIRDKLLAALALQFGVSESEAMEIVEYAPVDYTLKLQSIVDGTPFMKVQDMIDGGIDLEPVTDEDSATSPGNDSQDFPDMLPEEENIPVTGNDNTNQGSSVQNIESDGVEIIIESEQF